MINESILEFTWMLHAKYEKCCPKNTEQTAGGTVGSGVRSLTSLTIPGRCVSERCKIFFSIFCIFKHLAQVSVCQHPPIRKWDQCIKSGEKMCTICVSKVFLPWWKGCRVSSLVGRAPSVPDDSTRFLRKVVPTTSAPQHQLNRSVLQRSVPRQVL